MNKLDSVDAASRRQNPRGSGARTGSQSPRRTPNHPRGQGQGGDGNPSTDRRGNRRSRGRGCPCRTLPGGDRASPCARRNSARHAGSRGRDRLSIRGRSGDGTHHDREHDHDHEHEAVIAAAPVKVMN